MDMVSQLDRFAQMGIDGQFDGLIFDCDGTLTDSMPLHYEAWHQTMTRYGIEFTEVRFYSMAGMPSEKIIAELCHEQSKTIDIDTAAHEKETAFERLIDRLQPLDRVCHIAARYHGRLPMAVASGGIRRIIDAQLERIELSHLFSVRVTAEDTELHKPEPDVFLEAARQLGVSPFRCLVFEDSPLGFEAACRAGMGWVDVRVSADQFKIEVPADSPRRADH